LIEEKEINVMDDSSEMIEVYVKQKLELIYILHILTHSMIVDIQKIPRNGYGCGD
jgi:hypothetical protein